MYTADQRYAVNSQGQAVPDTDPDAQWLLVVEGGKLSDAEARKYGLLKDKPADEPEPDAPAEGKAIAEPPANKALTGPKASK